jgi:CheY-like chemotaxis protein
MINKFDMKKILVIDDDQIFRDLIANGVDKTQYEVTTAADGIEGMEVLEKATPDLILLDVMMPRMNGVEFLEKMKEKGDKQVPVIITSNDSSLDTISRGAELGVRGYIVKSSESMKTIMASIERVFDEASK